LPPEPVKPKAGRPLWWAAGLSLCLVVTVLVVVLRGNDHQVTLPDQHRPDRDDRAVLAGEALQDLATAATEGADPEDSDLVDQIAINARRLRLTDLSLRYVDEDAGALAAGSDEWVAAVETTWAFRGFDRTPAETEVSFTFRRDGDRADIVAIGGHDRRTPLWLSGPVTVRRTPRTLVIVAGEGDDAEAGRYAGLARTAVTEVNRVLPDWHRGLVVEVAASADALVAELDAKPDEYAQIAAVTTTVDGSTEADAPVHVFVNPEVFGPLQATGAQVVMTHESTHVATDAANATMPLWLVEGFADYVALRDVRLPLSVTAAQITDQVRRHGVPDHLPTDEEFGTTQTHLGAQYEAAWLACRTLADLGGEAKLVDFYSGVEHGGDQAAELRRIFGFSQRSFVRSWQQRLQDLAG
jgi:hypothetical protein